MKFMLVLTINLVADAIEYTAKLVRQTREDLDAAKRRTE